MACACDPGQQCQPLVPGCWGYESPNPCAEMSEEIDRLNGVNWRDRDDQWSADIRAAHPVNTGDGHTYLKALEMIEHRHSKSSLVDLVNWLLRNQKS